MGVRLFRSTPHVLAAAVGTSAVALLLAITLPRYHVDSASDDPEDSCCASQVFDLSATPPPQPTVSSDSLILVDRHIQLPTQAPQVVHVVRLELSRAPPQFSA